MSAYQLGDHVTMTGTVQKVHEEDWTRFRESGLPTRVAYPEDKIYTDGVIVGSRTVQEGTRWTDSVDDGWGASYYSGFTAKGEARRVWLVAYDLRRKHVMCFDHQISLKEPTDA